MINIKKHILILIALICGGSSLMGQNIISGKIQNRNGQPIKSAIIILSDINSESQLSYTTTDLNGYYKLQYASPSKAVLLKVKSSGYKTIEKNYDNQTQKIDITLDYQITEIKEVELSSKMISQKGDTISFNAGAFKQKSDRTLEDILKNMPGIEVENGGKIKYQGKYINKFYIENKDLTGGSYGIITKSLPKDDIDKVEIYENHQPIKALEGKSINYSPAVNIKLKNNVTLSGIGSVGSGFAEPWLWDVQLTPILFTKKNQALLSYKVNNIGKNVEDELKGLADSDELNGDLKTLDPARFLDIETIPEPPLPLKRYLLNNVHNLSANYLSNISKDWEIRLKLNYTNNWITQTAKINTLYPDNVRIERTPTSNIFQNHIGSEVRISKNTKKRFISNTLGWTGIFDNSNGIVENTLKPDNSNLPSDQKLRSPFKGFQNNFSAVIPIKNTVLNISSFLTYSNEAQSLKIIQSRFPILDTLSVKDAKALVQTFGKSRIKLQNSFFLKYILGNWSITPQIDSEINKDDIETYLYKMSDVNIDLGKDYANKNKYFKSISSGSVSVNYAKNKDFNIGVRLPFSLVYYNFTDHVRQKSTNFNGVAFNPNVNIYWSFKEYYSIQGTISHNKAYGLDDAIFTGKVLSTPISLISQNSPIPVLKNTSISTNLNYRNIGKKIFATIDGSYAINKSNVINKQNITETGISTEILGYENVAKNMSLGLRFSNYIPSLKTNTTVKYNVNQNHGFFYYKILNEAKGIGQNFSLSIENRSLSWVNLNYLVDYNSSNVHNITADTSNEYRSWKQSLRLYFYILQHNMLNFNFDRETSKNNYKTLINNFCDISYIYTWKKKNIDFELSWNNILNTQTYNIANVNNDLSLVNTTYFIRPSQLLLKVQFNFK